MPGRRLTHGYTNLSWVQDGRVVKQYDAVDGEERLRVEVAAMARAASAVPVPEIVEVDVPRRRLVLTFMAGHHGQELVDEGRGVLVLSAAGRTLGRLHDQVPGLVHGDYGPQNLLIDTTSGEVSAVLDWEFAHAGNSVEDLAWAEWTVRMHHPGAVAALPALFEGYGAQPSWPVRQGAMREKCAKLAKLCTHRGLGEAAEMWRSREQVTSAWTE